MNFSGLLLFLGRFALGFCLACSFHVVILSAYAFYIFYLIGRPEKKIKLNKKPIDNPVKEDTLIEPETALWLNSILDQLFYAAGGLRFVEIIHAAFIKTMEEKSSAIKSSDLRLLIEKLLVKDFHLGKRLPQLLRILTKGLDDGAFALVFDISFEHGCMITELGAEMGLGLKHLSAKLLATRFVGKMVFKFELLPNCRISFLASEMPHFRLFFSYGGNQMPRLSSVLEYVIRGVLTSRLIYPFYQSGILNSNAETANSLVYLSPANSVKSNLWFNIVRASIDPLILAECSNLQCSVSIVGENERIKTPFIPAKAPLVWKFSYSFQVSSEMEKLELSFRMINKKKLLGTHVLGQNVLPIKGIPFDYFEPFTIKLNEGVSLDVEIFCAHSIQSGFIDREWIFYNSTPPLPLFEDEAVTPSLDKVNWTNIKFVFEKLLSSSEQDNVNTNESNFESLIEEIPTSEIVPTMTSILSSEQGFLNLFCHAADSLVKLSSNSPGKEQKQ